MNDYELFDEQLVILDEPFNNRMDFFKKISNFLLAKNYVKEEFYDAITKREASYPTGLQTQTIGVAIPHTDPQYLKRPFIVIIRPKNKIQFEPMGMQEENIDAELIFMLGVMRDGGQVEVLQKIANMFMNDIAINSLLKAKNNKEIIDIVKNYFKDEISA